MKRKIFADKKGLTLLETMIALFVFSIGILAVASMQNVSLQSNASSARQMCFNVRTSVYLEQLLSLPYDDPKLKDVDDGFTPQTPDYGPIAIAGTSATVEWEIHEGFPVTNTKRIVIKTRWLGWGGKPQEVVYDYVLSKDLGL